MSPKNARLKTNGDQNSRSAIWTDATLGFLNGKFPIGIRCRGKFKVSLSILLELSLPWCRIYRGLGQELVLFFRTNIVAVDRMLPRVLGLDTFLFENHLVVELLWPRRERRARRITVALSNIFDVCQRVSSQKLLLSMSLELALSRCRIYRGFLDCPIFSLRSFNSMINIMDVKTIPWYDFVFSSLVFHDEMLFKIECTRSEVASFDFIGIGFVAMSYISRILGLSYIFLKILLCAF